jgi:hypothetical protein
MSIPTILNPRAVSGLAATAEATTASTSWKEPIGKASRLLALTGANRAMELLATLGAIGNYIAGTLPGAWSVSGSNTGTRASGTLTLTANPAAGETVTIGTKVYTFAETVGTTANRVLIGATASDTLDNLIAAVNGGAGSGTVYGSGTVAHTLVTAAAGSGDTAVITAVAYSSSGNSIATTETLANGSWGGSTLSGGVTPCSYEGGYSDISGNPLDSVTSLQGVEIAVLAGGVTIGSSNSKLSALAVVGPGVLLLAGDSVSQLATLTITATAADTTFAVTALYTH